jgi:hypothetical protein
LLLGLKQLNLLPKLIMQKGLGLLLRLLLSLHGELRRHIRLPE